MIRRFAVQTVIVALVVLGSFVVCATGWGASSSPYAQVMTPSSPRSGEAAEQTETPVPLTAAQARDLVARMSDQEARALLLSQLAAQEDAAASGPPAPTSQFFDVQASMYTVRGRLREMIAALPDLSSIGPFTVMRITKGYEPSHIWSIAWYMVVIFGGALVGEAVFRRMFRPVVNQLSGLRGETGFGKLGLLLLRALIKLLSIAAFAAVAAVLFLFVYKGHEVARIAFWSTFVFVILVRVAAVGLEVLLSTQRPELRLPDVDDATARRLRLSFLLLIALAAGSAILADFLEHIGVTADRMLAVNQLLLLANVFVQIVVIWAQRSSIARLIGGRGAHGEPGGPGVEALVARHWHVFAVSVILLMGVFATLHRLLTGETQAARIFPTLAVLIALPLIDGLLRMIVGQYFGGQSRSHAPHTHATDPDPVPTAQRSDHRVSEAGMAPTSGTNGDADYGNVVLRNGRILLALISVIVLADIWNIRLEALALRGIGADAAGALFDIAVTLILASAAWGIIKTAINRHLPHEGLDGLTTVDGDMGGAGRSRLETLLPLLRKFLYIALIVIVVMIVISSLGINIGPLLAGAGVVGIAVGFGAQTLVRDVISGVFFLIDDAFRVGEYIDVGEGKGTVEGMSVRSLMLRHHLGPINTIPFGAIQRVTNFSRDWVIMKLEMRVPFETDLEKLRKLVKRVGVEMMDDPTYGPNFIQPLKSQGAHHMDDSSFVIRVKFMAKPGEQFVLRREVFRRLQEAFQANGIKFAPRRVIVDTTSASAATTAAAAVADEGAGRAPATP